MQKTILSIVLILIFISCKNSNPQSSTSEENKDQASKNNIEFAQGFSIDYFEGYKVISLKNAWPGANQVFSYALVEKGHTLSNPENYDAIVQVPVEKIIVSSTTHIPSLEMLEEDKNLIGFPNLDYISSEKTRKHIDAGSIAEIGRNQDINTEIVIDLQPDLFVGFAVEGTNKTLNNIAKSGIPVVYNGDWTETSPLGKAEWIKFFGAFFNKEDKANEIFSKIKSEYNLAKEIASKAARRPTVLSGAMYKDIWYLPQGNSWAAQFIKDANGRYLWEDSQSTGSISLNIESVLEKGQNARYWIGAGQFISKSQMTNAHPVYKKFDAFQNNRMYSFTAKKGPTGGVLYYELAPNRPDIVLKDIIKILHPDLLPNHEMYFFDKIE